MPLLNLSPRFYTSLLCTGPYRLSYFTGLGTQQWTNRFLYEQTKKKKQHTNLIDYVGDTEKIYDHKHQLLRIVV